MTAEDYQYGATKGWLRLQDDTYGLVVECVGELARPPRIRDSQFGFAEPGTEHLFRAISLCTIVTWWIEALRDGAYICVEGYGWREDRELLPTVQRDTYFVV